MSTKGDEQVEMIVNLNRSRGWGVRCSKCQELTGVEMVVGYSRDISQNVARMIANRHQRNKRGHRAYPERFKVDYVAVMEDMLGDEIRVGL